MKTILFNPFEIYSEKKLVTIGILTTVAGSLLAYFFNTRYDGVIDIHIIPQPNTLTSLLDNAIAVACLWFTLGITGKIINNKTRIIDVLAYVLIARTPYYLLPIFNGTGAITESSKKLIDPSLIQTLSTTEWIVFGLFSVLSLLCLVWMIALLFNGYKTASNAKGNKAVAFFVLALIGAEALSKVILSIL